MTKSTETGLMEVINFFTGNKAKIEAAAEKAAAEESSPEEIVKKLIKKAEAAAAAEEKAAAATKEEIENRLVIGAEEIKTLEVGQVDSIVYLKKLKTTLKRLQNESTSGNYKAPPSHETILKGSIKTTENQIKICKSKITQATQKLTKDLMEITERQANSDPVQTYINTLDLLDLKNDTYVTIEADIQKELIDAKLEELLDSLKEEANNGNPDAMFLIGYHLNPLVTGLDVDVDVTPETEKSFQESLKWFSMGVKKGHLKSAIAIKNIFSNLERGFEHITEKFLNESEKIIEEFLSNKKIERKKFKKDIDDLYNHNRNVRPEKLESAAEPLNNLLAEFNEVGYGEFGSTEEIDDFKEKLKKVIKDVNDNIYYHAEGMGLYKT